MKISELIAKLQLLPADAHAVLKTDHDCMYVSVKNFTLLNTIAIGTRGCRTLIVPGGVSDGEETIVLSGENVQIISSENTVVGDR